RLETISVAVGSQIRFLHQVLGVLWLPREAQRAPIERVDMPLKKRKVATHANALLVHSIPANSASRPVPEDRPAAGRGRGPDLDVCGLARLLEPHWGGHDTCQPAGTAAPARLLACVWVLMLDPLFELRQPLLHRPLDLRSRSARLLRPDAWPVRANGFGRRVGIGRFRFDRELRREFRHLCESYPWPLPEPVGDRSS